MQFAIRFGLVAALLTLVQSAYAFRVAVTATSCASMTFTLTLTPAEIAGAAGLGVYPSFQLVRITRSPKSTSMAPSLPSTRTRMLPASLADSPRHLAQKPLYSASSTVRATSLPPSLRFSTNHLPVWYRTQHASCQRRRYCHPTSAAAGSSATGTTDNGSGSTNSNSGSNTNGSSNNGNASANSGSSSGSSSNTGAIAGGVAGGAAALIALALVAFCLKKKKKNKRAQQSRLRNDEADEAAFRAPNNNDSTASLATAPENADTPMMRDISTKNVFADPTTSATSGAPSGSSGAFSGSNVAAAGAGAAAGGIGAAAIAARKHSREQSRARSPSNLSERRPSSEFSKDNTTPMSQNPPPVPALPSNAASLPAKRTPSPPTSAPQASSPLSNTASSAAPAAAAGAAATTAAAAVAASKAGSNDKDNKAKTSKWGFGKRASKDESATTKLPYPSAVPEPISSPESESEVAAAPTSSPKKAVQTPSSPASPTRSFNVIQKQPAAVPTSTAGPSSASIAPSERSLNRPPVFPRDLDPVHQRARFVVTTTRALPRWLPCRLASPTLHHLFRRELLRLHPCQQASLEVTWPVSVLVDPSPLRRVTRPNGINRATTSCPTLRKERWQDRHSWTKISSLVTWGWD